jgi:hypothetical protein
VQLEQDHVIDITQTCKSAEDKGTTIRLWDGKRGIGLEVRVYQLQLGIEPGNYEYEQLKMSESDTIADNGPPEAQIKNKVKAYNAVVKLQESANNEHVHSEPRSATFLAAIRFFEAASPPLPSTTPTSEDIPAPISKKWPSLPEPKDIYEYVGVSPSSSKATGAMWDTVFIERRKKSDSVLDLNEVSLIGRSLEKILQVDIVPAFFSDTKDTQDQATTKQQTEVQEKALVSNIFVRPNVDLKALL